MNYRTLNKLFAALVFLGAMLTYLLTLQPSVPFWDCGEFAAASMWQQVPHPPGAPLWLMAAKAVEVILPGDPGHNFNVFAALCSAFAALFAYLIAVNAVERFRPYDPARPTSSYIGTYAAGLIGAFAFIWSDSNWFNSVESEVYSAATLLTALVMWMMMKWDQQAERPGHERWMLLLAYVFGLAIGVHLLALLVIPSIALTIYFRRYRKPTAVSLLTTAGLTAVVFYALYQGSLTAIPWLFSASTIGGVLLLAAIVGGAFWGFRNKKPIVFLAASSLALVILGFTSYTQILVRSSAHPVMNENEPDTFDELRRYLGREQYGDRPYWPRRVDYHNWHAERMASYGTPTPPENINGELEWPNGIDLGAEINYTLQYQIYEMYLRYLFWNFVGRDSDMQDAGVSMFGEVSDETVKNLIRPTGAEDVFPVSFFMIPLLLGLIGIVVHFKRDWRMATVFMTAFLFLGVLAALQQRQQDPQPRERDYFYAGSFLVFSIWVGFGAMGVADAFGSKKVVRRDDGDDVVVDPDRPVTVVRTDGVDGNIPLKGAILAACFLAAPLNMAINGWELHDRSGNWLTWDYAYNILQSVDKDAILFTNGDNDTFPLWYMQDVGGVRRDVRVVNLELAQTPWYIWQMKKEPSWDAAPVPLDLPDEMIRDNGKGQNQVSYAQGTPQQIVLPVPAALMSWATKGESTSAGTMVWDYTPQDMGGGQMYFSPKNQIVRSIVETNAKQGWKRPIFFSLTSGNEYAGLTPYLRQEGMAYRVMPVRQQGIAIDIDMMRKSLLKTLEGDKYFPDQHYGFKFRGLNDPDVRFLGQDDHRRPMNIFYHRLYLAFAEQYLYVEENKKGAIEVLDKMIEVIPPGRFGPPVPYGETYSFLTKIAELYRDAGAVDKAREWAQKARTEMERVVKTAAGPRMISNEDYTPSEVAAKTSAIMGNYAEALKLYDDILAQAPDNMEAQVDRASVQIQQKLAAKDSAGARAVIQEAIKGYGSADDPRSRLLLSRHAWAIPGLDAALDNAAVDSGGDGVAP